MAKALTSATAALRAAIGPAVASMLATTCVVPAASAQEPAPAAEPASAEFVPERLSVEERIKPGPNLFSIQQDWHGASSIHVFGADGLEYKGNMSTGMMAQMKLSPDGKTAYSTAFYMERLTYGEMKAFLEVFDVETLKLKSEVAIPVKAAMVAAHKSLLELSADGRFVYIQNATPATSVTVVDIAAGKVSAEIPTPGCWGVFPTLEGHRFSTLCGDGRLSTFALAPDGTSAEKSVSEKIFDADTDPLYVHAERMKTDLAFLSFTGTIYEVADAGPAPVLTKTFSIVEGVEGGWAPGGYSVIAYNEANDVMFVAMHPEAVDGSHKNAAEEIWAVDMATDRLLYRSPTRPVIAIDVSAGPVPQLFGYDEDDEMLIAYEVTPAAQFAAKETATFEKHKWSTLVEVRP